MYAVIAQPARDFVNLGSRIETPFAKATPRLFCSKILSQSHSNKFKHSLTRSHEVKSKDGCISLKCKPCLRVQAPFVLGPKRRVLKLSAFKSNGQNDDSGGRANGSKSLKNSISLSYAPQDSEATIVESPKAQSVPASFPSEAESSTHSLAIQNLFKSWLMLLRVPSVNQTVDKTLERPSSIGTSDTHNSIQLKDKVSFVRAVCCYLMDLDATVKIPLLIFIPWYLAVNFMYGAEVSKELTPLWVFGPLIAALYIKLLRRICALYVFTFKLTVKVLRNLPTYCTVAHNYLVQGKIKEVRLRLLQPLVDIKKSGYKQVARRVIEDMRVDLTEKYLDFIESIWPYYCRMIRFLKRAKLI